MNEFNEMIVHTAASGMRKPHTPPLVSSESASWMNGWRRKEKDGSNMNEANQWNRIQSEMS